MYEINESLQGLHTTCASCKKECCVKGITSGSELPKNCPMRNQTYMDTLFEPYTDPEIHRFYVSTKVCSGTEDQHRYTPRLRSVINLCKHAGFKRIGLAFCRDFMKEAQLYASIIRKHGIEVVAVCCANGGYQIEAGGSLRKTNSSESPMCNPVGQAMVMNFMDTEFNLVMGLCIGSEALFIQQARAMSSVVLVKDPVTCHRPLAALRLEKNYAHIFYHEEEKHDAV